METHFDRCTKCVISAQFPGVEFDDKGVCNFCRDQVFYVTQDERIEQARVQIETLFNEKRGKSEYDAIVCYSGGKDSTYTLQLAVEKYKLKVLSFTMDNGFISPVAFDNINRVVSRLGIDHITFRPSSKFMMPLYRISSLENIYNPKTLLRISSNCNSCISVVNMTALKYALEKKIPFILAGFTLGQIPSNTIIYKNNYRFFQESREPILNKLRERLGKEVDDYFTIKDALLDSVAEYPSNINLLCLEDISESEIIEKVKAIGWVPPKDVDGCSSNCRLNTFNNYIHQKRYGYNPYELELSHLIRKGKLTRDEALVKLADQPEETLASIKKELGID
jgi:tRNA(Ile)-lysidine synthase TilS/MesJ